MSQSSPHHPAAAESPIRINERHRQCRRPGDDLDRLAEAADRSVSAQAFGGRRDRLPHPQQCGDRSRSAAQVPMMTMSDIKYPGIRVQLTGQDGNA